jgi:hypothetical protein
MKVSARSVRPSSRGVTLGMTSAWESACVAVAPNTVGNGCMSKGSLLVWKVVTSQSPSQ